ncbi:hypothetical protein A2U01_0070658, partial [Trifolium medium]|nr:hypothetical protein [Trifolium medium]
MPPRVAPVVPQQD